MKHRKQLGEKNTIGTKITALRKACGMKQKELMAQMQTRGIDIGQTSLSNLEGQTRLVRAEEIVALADIFGITTDELLIGKKDS